MQTDINGMSEILSYLTTYITFVTDRNILCLFFIKIYIL